MCALFRGFFGLQYRAVRFFAQKRSDMKTFVLINRHRYARSAVSACLYLCPTSILLDKDTVNNHSNEKNESEMIDQFIKQLGTGLGQAAETLGKLPKEEIQAQLHEVARNTLSKMDLVTREEFEVQAAMLAKYREKLTALEARLNELEKDD